LFSTFHSYSTYQHYATLNPGVTQPNPPYLADEVTKFQDDGIWLISCSFSIWTMVSGDHPFLGAFLLGNNLFIFD
jgi:hypothetical protein